MGSSAEQESKESSQWLDEVAEVIVKEVVRMESAHIHEQRPRLKDDILGIIRRKVREVTE